MNPPKCYTWLESYGSPLSDGKKKKNFLNPISRQNFAYAFAETPLAENIWVTEQEQRHRSTAGGQVYYDVTSLMKLLCGLQ